MRILVIDDSADTADLMLAILCAAGHDVQAAYRGDRGVEIAETFEPELAFVDIQMPDMGGFAVASLLRKRLGRRVHIVAITGGDARRLPRAGNFNQHAIKPITATRLYQAIDIARDALRSQ